MQQCHNKIIFLNKFSTVTNIIFYPEEPKNPTRLCNGMKSDLMEQNRKKKIVSLQILYRPVSKINVPRHKDILLFSLFSLFFRAIFFFSSSFCSYKGKIMVL